jgi:hypothetical protein
VAEHAPRLLEREAFAQKPRGEEVAQAMETIFEAPARLALGVAAIG